MDRTTFPRSLRWGLPASAICCAALGCSSLTGGLGSISPFGDSKTKTASVADRAAAASETLHISNPPAKQIRFVGQEQLLGGGTCQSIAPELFHQNVAQLLKQNKHRSATAMIGLHPRSAQQLLIQDLRGNEATLDFIAAQLDRDRSDRLWTDHRLACNDDSGATESFRKASENLIKQTNGDQAIEKHQAELLQVAEQTTSVPLAIEAQRLVAVSRFAREQIDVAIDQLVQAAEQATQAGLSQMSSDLWMMACEASLQAEAVDQARSCWKAAVANQLASIRSRSQAEKLPPVDTVFWEQADRLIHPEDSFPAEVALAFSPWYSRIGIRGGDASATTAIPPRVALWSSIAKFQLVTGQPHLATLSVKRAEVDAAPEMKPWLQIMSARALAAQSQTELATTILASLTGHDDPSVRAESLATLGSIKVQDGAYQQGSRFLIEALNLNAATKWPGRLAAKADLANVRLIVGSTDEAIRELHAVQNEMMIAGQWQALCQSLENEAAILESENQVDQAKQIRNRIATIEQS